MNQDKFDWEYYLTVMATVTAGLFLLLLPAILPLWFSDIWLLLLGFVILLVMTCSFWVWEE